ncbi:MAG: methionyl-tRNA formyltransferase [Clostridia bacterium]|nr:methionyl-tRNA formyltransferase [Clostridia bacterium]
MGTPDFAVPSLERLISEGHEVCAVVTQPDKKRGRGGAVSFSPVKSTAVSKGIKVLQPLKARDAAFISELSGLQADFFVTCAYGLILPKAVLDIPPLGCINVHASLLPEYRGAAPIQRAVINGESYTGVTTMMTDAGMDTGDILLSKKIEIPEDMTSGELHDKLKIIGADLLMDTIERLSQDSLARVPQDDSKASYAPMLRKEEGIIDWKSDSRSIHNKIRALDPWPGCFTTYKRKRMRIFSSRYVNGNACGIPGEITAVSKDKVVVCCGRGSLCILGVQFENGRRVHVAECWHNFKTNEVLGREEW